MYSFLTLPSNAENKTYLTKGEGELKLKTWINTAFKLPFLDDKEIYMKYKQQ